LHALWEPEPERASRLWLKVGGRLDSYTRYNRKSIYLLGLKVNAFALTRMTNQLSIPFKRTYAIPLRDAVDAHIRSKHHNVHPEAFKWDINRWEELRKAVTSSSVHVDQVEAILA
jgi:hypothetical protein